MSIRRTHLVAALFALALAPPARAQVRVDALTEVRKIRFSGAQSIPERRLRELLQTRDRPSNYGLRSTLGKLPLIPSPARYPFSPLVLQQDVVRLRGAYTAAGFLSAHVRYDVQRDDEKNLLDVTFVVDEGEPTVLTEVAITGPDSVTRLPVPPDEQKSWSRLERSVLAQQGRRLDVAVGRQAGQQLARWWRDRGHPRAFVATAFQTDSTRLQGRMVYRVVPGPSAVFGDVRIEGNRTISDASLRKRVPIEPGTPYSVQALDTAKKNLQEMEIMRLATVDVPALTAQDTALTKSIETRSEAALDSILPVRVRITEAEPRFVSGDIGYVTDGGVSSEGRWTHRNFTGGGRTLTVTGLAQTGWLTISDNPDIRYRLAVSLKQPGIVHRHLSAVLSPFLEHRDDSQDRSNQVGTNATLVYQTRQLRSVSLDYQIAWRRVYEYRLEDLANGDVDLLTFLTRISQGVDSLGSTLRSSTVTLASTYGFLDDPANPRRGAVVRPTVQVSAPVAWSTTSFWKLDMQANSFVPLGRAGVFMTRVSLGRLFPFGKSLPSDTDSEQAKFLQLRDVSFTAGGTADARGWDNRLLGPKVPDVRFETVNDSILSHVEGYVPLGGFARASFQLELQLPLPPFGSKFGSHFFLDGGRVWTDDARFGMEGDPHGQEKLFFATGAGIGLRTPVGPIKLSVGYKINPSVIDLADANDVLQAAREHRPIEDVAQKNSRRWQLHLAIGVSY